MVNHRIANAVMEPGFLIGLDDRASVRERPPTQARRIAVNGTSSPWRTSVIALLTNP